MHLQPVLHAWASRRNLALTSSEAASEVSPHAPKQHGHDMQPSKNTFQQNTSAMTADTVPPIIGLHFAMTIHDDPSLPRCLQTALCGANEGIVAAAEFLSDALSSAKHERMQGKASVNSIS